MSVKTDSTGRRFVSVEAEVPGNPDDVWRVIATGPGVSSWFVPTEIEGREGGRIVSRFGSAGDAVATITAWDPPRRMAAVSEIAPDAPPFATEWFVEARGGGTCVVRVVHSLFTDRDSWDDQLEGTESGWPSFFRVLKLYLRHYAGLPSTPFQAMAMTPDGMTEAWGRLIRALGSTVDVGQRLQPSTMTPSIAGVVEHHASPEGSRSLIVRIDQPAPGIVLFGAHRAGPQVCVVMSGYLYGAEGAAAATQVTQWQPWFDAVIGSAPAQQMPSAGI